MRISILLVLLLAAGFIQAQVSDFGKQTPFLLENKGQVSNSDGTAADQVLYYMNTPKMDFYLTQQGITYVFKKGILSDVEPGNELKPAEVKEVQWHRVDVTPLNGHMNLTDVEVTYAKQGTVSIFNQLVPKGIEHMRPVESVTFRNVYPGIDWQFVVDADYLKYNFILHKGADMSQIQLRFDGQDNIQIKDNRLLVETSLGSLAENEIVSFTSSKKTVDVQAKLNNNILTYECSNLPQLAAGETLTIDPPLVWATYFGGSLADNAVVMERNNNGFIYVLIKTLSTDFPVLSQGGMSYYKDTLTGNYDIGILKFTENGVRVWTTYYGGTLEENPSNLFYNGTILMIVGTTYSSDFPTGSLVPGAYIDASIGGTRDGFIIAFTIADLHVWSTYLGGSGNDDMNDCTFKNNQLLVAGQTLSSDFPLMPNGAAYYVDTLGFCDVFITEFSSSFSLTWSTFLGASYIEGMPYCDIDSIGRLCVSYPTFSSDLPLINTIPGSYSQTYGGNGDFGITLFDASRQIIWQTYYGGPAEDNGQDLICDYNNGWIIAGYTKSVGFPVVNNIGAGFYQPVKGEASTANEAFILKFNSNCERQYSSFYGGSSHDVALGLTMDSYKNLYVVGYTNSTNLPTHNPLDGSYFDGISNGGADEFLMELDSNINMKWATYLGGSANDRLNDVRVSPSDHVFAIGWTLSLNHPLQDMQPGVSYFDNTLNAQDAVIMKFIPCPENFDTIWAPDSVCYGETIDVYATGSHTYTWNTGSTNDSIQAMIVSDTSFSVVATYLTCIERDTVFIKVKPLPIITFAGDSMVCMNDSMHLSASGGVAYAWENGFNTDSISFLPAASDIISVTVTNSYGCVATDSIQTTVYPLPVPVISGDNTPCLLDTTTLSASGGVSYVWSNTATTPSIDLAWNSTGTFDYYAIATDVNGCADTAFFTATVTNLPEFWLGNDTVICDLTTITLDPVIAGAGYLWNTGAATPTLDVSTSNTYWLDLNDANNCHFRDTIQVTVQPLPVITFGGDTTVCFSHPITITASGGTSYAWENSLSGSSITFVPAASDTLTVLVTDIYGCSSTDSVGFDVLPLPVPAITGNTEICQFDTTTLTASGGVAYQWSSGQPTVTADIYSTVAGLYTYYVIATAPNGCTDTAFHQLTVHAIPAVNLGADTTICEGTSLLLDAANSGAAYNWSTSASTQTITVNTAGTYLVTVTDAFTCHNTDSIVVATQPYADATITDIAFICLNDNPVIYVAAQPGGIWSGDGITNATNGVFNPLVAGTGISAIVYTISGHCGNSDTSTIEVGALPQIAFTATDETCPGFNDGELILEISGGTAPYISELDTMFIGDTTLNLSPGAYLLTVTDFRGCASTDSVTILAEETPCGEVDFYIPNIFSPNGDLQNDVLLVRSDFIQSMSWYVYDRYGEKVFESKDINLGWDGEYQGEPVQSGVYFWFIKVTYNDSSTVEREGNVTLVR